MHQRRKQDKTITTNKEILENTDLLVVVVGWFVSLSHAPVALVAALLAAALARVHRLQAGDVAYRGHGLEHIRQTTLQRLELSVGGEL